MGQASPAVPIPSNAAGTILSIFSTLLTIPSRTLLLALGIAFLVWYVKFLWHKRYHYYYAYKTPGPFSLPIIGIAYKFVWSPQDIPQTIAKLGQKYIKSGIYTLWLGSKPHYIVNDVKYLQLIMSHPNTMHKDTTYRFFADAVGQSLITATSLSVWKTHRKLISPSFSQRILQDFFKIFVKQAEILCEEVAVESGKGVFPLNHYIERCTLDIIMESAMGAKLNCQTLNKEHMFIHYVNRGFAIIMERTFNIFYFPDIIFYNSPPGKFLKEALNKTRSFVTEVVQQRKQVFEKNLKESTGYYQDDDYKSKAPFLDSLLETIYEEKQYWTDKELIDETLLFLIAGFDTTGTAISAVLMSLGMFPDIQEKLYQEVVKKVGLRRSLVYTDLAELKYCQRVIKESLRLFSSLLIGRYAAEDLDLGDYVIPKGATILVDFRTASRNPKYWKDPLKFDPDRFLPENMDGIINDPANVMAFSYGPRNCIGQRYAMLEMTTIVATFVRKYTLYSEYKSVEEVAMKLNGVLKPLHGFKTSIELRKE